MYDVSGVKGSDVEKGIKEDWMHLVRRAASVSSRAIPANKSQRGMSVISSTRKRYWSLLRTSKNKEGLSSVYGVKTHCPVIPAVPSR
jgi:hypothetical protein